MNMAFRLTVNYDNERSVSQSIIQATELLGMYHAELARILGQQCSDIGELTSGKCCLIKDSEAWSKAVLFIEVYNLLFDHFDGDSVAMYHWMRAHNRQLNGTPHLLIVDQYELERIHDYLQQLNKSAVSK